MSKKCILIGMDGVNPRFVLRMIEQGKLGNFKRMMEEGSFAPHCLSSLPTSTPENWTTIATGAWNGTHQVMSFQTFSPPELRGNWMTGYSSKESEAEFIWDAVERAGKQSILLKYPASHPPTMSTGVQVCGCHVRPCAHQIDGAHYFSTHEPRNTALELREAAGEADLLESKLPVLMGELRWEPRGLGMPSRGEGLDERTALYGVPDGKTPKGDKPEGVGLDASVCRLVPPGKALWLFVLATEGDKYDRVIITRDPESRERLAELALGEWSPWLLEKFETIDGTRAGPLRFKLDKLSADGKQVGLYATQVMDLDLYAMPRSVGRELYEKVGPFITDIGWEGLGHNWTKAWFHESVMTELAEYQHEWFAKAVEYLTKTRDWALLMLQAHCIDCANHYCLGMADPVSNPDRQLGGRFLTFIEGLYQSLDRLLGRIMDLVDEDTVIFVVSDHGGLPGHLRVDRQQTLEEAGLLVTGEDGGIDWERTRAYVQKGMFINVNLQGREKHGIVPPEEYDKTCDEIIAALHAYTEPTTGLHPYNLVLRRTDMRYVGLYGDPTYQKIGDLLATVREPFGGTHGEQLSTAAWGLSSNTCLLMMRGPGIRKGVQLERTAWLTDIVPTICNLIDVPVPRDTEGAILYQALEEQRAR